MCDAICKKEKCFQSWIASIAVITDYQLPVDTGMKYQVKLLLQLICWKRKITKFPSGVISSWLKSFLFNYKESSFGSRCIPLWVDEFLQCQPGKHVKDLFPSCASRGKWKGSECLCIIRSVEKAFRSLCLNATTWHHHGYAKVIFTIFLTTLRKRNCYPVKRESVWFLSSEV